MFEIPLNRNKTVEQKKAREKYLRALRKAEKPAKEKREAGYLRYAEKRAKVLGITAKKFLENKKARDKERRAGIKKVVKKVVVKRVKFVEPSVAKNSKKKVDFESLSVRFPRAEKGVDYLKVLDQLCKLCKDKKFGDYDGNEFGLGKFKDFAFYFNMKKGVSAAKVGKQMSTIIKKYKWSKGVVIRTTKMYTDDTAENSKIEL